MSELSPVPKNQSLSTYPAKNQRKTKEKYCICQASVSVVFILTPTHPEPPYADLSMEREKQLWRKT